MKPPKMVRASDTLGPLVDVKAASHNLGRARRA